MATTASVVMTECNRLKRFWNSRNEKFKEWYKLIQMVDELKQENMESFVGNDPRAAFNLLLGMLEQRIPHRILPEKLTMEQTAPASELSKLFDKIWEDIFKSYRRRGRYFLRDLISFLLSTGWYSVFATMSMDGSRAVAEIWNPTTVFPEWDTDMVGCAHIIPVTAAQARRMIARNRWNARPPRGQQTIYDYWRLEEEDKVFNSIVLGSELVKPDIYEPKFKRIPIFISPVGGLPDTGELASPGETDRWKQELGQAVVATNENVYKYFNKWWTFNLQLLRDTAQPRTFEKSSSAVPIVKPERWYAGRGAHFRMGPNDEIGYITPPGIPVELRSTQLDMEAMLQRGGPSWAMFGSVQQQMTSYVMSQITASAHQISKPYHQGVVDCITDIDNFLYSIIKENNYKPYGIGLPEDLPEDAEISADYELRIPGDLIQRVTTARIMNPAFELSDNKVMEELFPEIKNPVEELAKIRAGKARRHPVHVLVATIESFREEADLLRRAGDGDGAALYEKAADMAEASLTPQEPEEEVAPEGVRPPPARPEVMPPPSPAAPM